MRQGRISGWMQAVAALMLAVLILAACGASTPAVHDTPLPTGLPVPSATLGELPSATPALLADTATPEMPAPDVHPTDAGAQQVVTLAVADLSQQLSVPEESVLVESVEAVEAVQWPDASLGCPQPGTIYA